MLPNDVRCENPDSLELGPGGRKSRKGGFTSPLKTHVVRSVSSPTHESFKIARGDLLVDRNEFSPSAKETHVLFIDISAHLHLRCDEREGKLKIVTNPLLIEKQTYGGR